MKRSIIFYILVVGVFATLMWVILQHGNQLESVGVTQQIV